MAVAAAPAGQSTPSPSPRPKSPVSRLFHLSSSQQSDLTTTSHSNKSVSRISEAFSTLGGRTRTLSTDSDSRNNLPKRSQEQEDRAVESSFGIGELLFRRNSSFLYTFYMFWIVSVHIRDKARVLYKQLRHICCTTAVPLYICPPLIFQKKKYLRFAE